MLKFWQKLIEMFGTPTGDDMKREAEKFKDNDPGKLPEYGKKNKPKTDSEFG